MPALSNGIWILREIRSSERTLQNKLTAGGTHGQSGSKVLLMWGVEGRGGVGVLVRVDLPLRRRVIRPRFRSRAQGSSQPQG